MAWLIKSGDKVEITSSPNQDSPIMEGKFPVMGWMCGSTRITEVSESPARLHRRWWNVVNWEAIEERFNSGK